jgi:hypothetical protein
VILPLIEARWNAQRSGWLSREEVNARRQAVDPGYSSTLDEKAAYHGENHGLTIRPCIPGKSQRRAIRLFMEEKVEEMIIRDMSISISWDRDQTIECP